MGQYYNIIIRRKGESVTHAYDRTIDGNYTMAKLMEHSYYLNDMVNAISEKLYNTPSHIAWVGDYAEGEKGKLHALAWKSKRYKELHKTDFTLNGRFLVNHTKKQILDCWDYLRNSFKNNKERYIVHPLPLLTAVGNGLGGGDYRQSGNDYDKVGSWAWDVIEIVEWETAREYAKNKGYTNIMVRFED